MATPEDYFRAQMTSLRRSKELSQTELANRLRVHGLPFHQQTIAKIESGERPVRLDEADLIARELGSHLSDMTRGVADHLSNIGMHIDQVMNDYNKVVDGTRGLVPSISFLQMAIESAAKDPDITPNDLVVGRSFLERTPWDAVQEGLAKVLADDAADDVRDRFNPESNSLRRIQELWEQAMGERVGEHPEAP